MKSMSIFVITCSVQNNSLGLLHNGSEEQLTVQNKQQEDK